MAIAMDMNIIPNVGVKTTITTAIIKKYIPAANRRFIFDLVLDIVLFSILYDTAVYLFCYYAATPSSPITHLHF